MLDPCHVEIHGKIGKLDTKGAITLQWGGNRSLDTLWEMENKESPDSFEKPLLD